MTPGDLADFRAALAKIDANQARRDQVVAQAAVNAYHAYLLREGRLLTPGVPLTVKTVNRNAAGQIVAVIEETVTVHERTHFTEARP